MTNIKINMDLSSIERTFNTTQICFLHIEQQCFVGDIFSLTFDGELRYYKIIDVWSVPKDFVIKFIWRMNGMESGKQLIEKFNDLTDGKIFVHFYTHIPSGTLKNLVKS